MKQCPACKNSNIKFVYKFNDGAATQNRLYNTLDKALRVRKTVVNLYGCKNCGFLFNAYFDKEETKYLPDYDNTQDTSKYFRNYLIKIAKQLNQKYKLRNKAVVEVGCGKGFFLKLLNDLGVKNIRGFDATYVKGDSKIDKLVIRKNFNIKNIKKKADFIVCRHVLEHVPNPHFFVSSIGKCLKNNGSMYFEFPSLEWIVKNRTFFDFFYEHRNYFSKNSVIKLFGQFGFKNIVFKYGLGGQYFRLEIKYGGKAAPIVDKKVNFNNLSVSIDNQMEKYRKVLSSANSFMVWGAGAKGVTFLNRLAVKRDRCKYIIDISSNKQNKFIPITGQKVVSPKILEKIKVDALIIMNPVYKKEIKKIALQRGYKGKFILL